MQIKRSMINRNAVLKRMIFKSPSPAPKGGDLSHVGALLNKCRVGPNLGLKEEITFKWRMSLAFLRELFY